MSYGSEFLSPVLLTVAQVRSHFKFIQKFARREKKKQADEENVFVSTGST